MYTQLLQSYHHLMVYIVLYILLYIYTYIHYMVCIYIYNIINCSSHMIISCFDPSPWRVKPGIRMWNMDEHEIDMNRLQVL
jgi:hypothetical protein